MDAETKNYRYVIYARKSTEEGDRQGKSIPREIADCKALAERLNLTVIGEPIEESKSAKKPKNRPKFSQIMRDIAAGKIDGIIAWHPDRLSRNMVEGGKIIHMLDTDVIKDLKFHSHQFSNDANGKMLLGMLFVFAKHYSDDLSHKVKSGNRRNLSIGKSGGTPKYGYIHQSNGTYLRDGQNFDLIQQAWQMRSNGKSYDEISGFLNDKGYQRFYVAQETHRKVKITKSMLGRIFNDSFYYGLLNQANQTVDLREFDPTFEPMVDEKLFAKVQALNLKSRRSSGKKKQIFLPLRNLIYCENCHFDKPMIVSTPRGGDNRRVLRYSCRNKSCTRSVKSIVAKMVFDEIAKCIDENLTIGINAYEQYKVEIKELSGNDKVMIRTQLNSVRASHNALTAEWNQKRHAIGVLTDPKAQLATNQEIADLQSKLDHASKQITEYEQKLLKETDKTKAILTKKEFEKLLRTTGKKLAKADPVQKDLLITELFLTIGFKDQKIVSYQWKYPFDELQKLAQVSNGRASGT